MILAVLEATTVDRAEVSPGMSCSYSRKRCLYQDKEILTCLESRVASNYRPLAFQVVLTTWRFFFGNWHSLRGMAVGSPAPRSQLTSSPVHTHLRLYVEGARRLAAP